MCEQRLLSKVGWIVCASFNLPLCLNSTLLTQLLLLNYQNFTNTAAKRTWSTMLDLNEVPLVIELTLLKDSRKVSTREVLTALSAAPAPNITRGRVFYSIFPVLLWVLYSDFHFCQAKEDIFYHNGFISDVYRPTQTGYYTLKNCTSGTILLELVFTSNNTS